MTTYTIGQTLAGGYRIIDVKAGGMGVVYICHQSGTDQYYAIKTVKFQSEHDSEELARRFRNEVFEWIKISNQRKHENVVQALLYNQDERWLFLEYVDGLPLHQTVPKCPAHIRHAVDWARGIAAGMDCLHREFSYIHRDLKPQNVMISEVGLVPKITDLGIGKVIQEGASEHTLIGTPGYMAPESFQGQADFRTDIYAYGAVVYRLIAGEPPFGKGAPAFDRLPPPPSEKRDGVPAELDQVVQRCLEPDPGKRYQTFEDILGDLDQLPTLMDDDGGREYRYCKVHNFFSPVSARQTECLFCDQQSKHSELMEAATDASVGFSDEVATIPLEGATPISVSSPDEGAPVSAPQVDVVPSTATAPSEVTRTAPPVPDPAPVPDPVRPWSPAKLIAVVVTLMVVGVGSAVGINQLMSPDKKPEPFAVPVTRGDPIPAPRENGPEVPVANGGENGAPGTAVKIVGATNFFCTAEGCGREFERYQGDEASYENEAGERITALQKVCRADHHFVCKECKARYAERLDRFELCDVCGETRSTVDIERAKSQGWFPDR